MLVRESLDEGLWRKGKAKLAGMKAGVSQATKNIGAAIKGDKESFKDTAYVANTAKLKNFNDSAEKGLLSIKKDFIDLYRNSKKMKSDKRLLNASKQYYQQLNKLIKMQREIIKSLS